MHFLAEQVRLGLLNIWSIKIFEFLFWYSGLMTPFSMVDGPGNVLVVSSLPISCAIVQAVSCRLHTTAAWVRCQIMLDLWWTKWHWRQVFPEYFCFPYQFSFNQCYTVSILTASVINQLKKIFIPVLVTVLFWNVGNHVLDYMAS
jgi:hypothetical protein